ncbi:type II toxin-antitoxin system MqsA family antitoxin [Pontibacter ruber]|uniref:Type II toxin-antitoxin system MqsA family antitoxin n=1 Tax=Pontibacter ruber TaxID=1343895 RepID=A0ABW5CVD0_9BACT|nr:type II toxin-antitoxin system MqsA family antitoxin [Pontibacter ruber]
MKSPYTGGEVRKITAPETITFKDEQFTLEVESYECVDTGNRFATGEMNDAVIERVHNLWRERHKIPTIAQLQAIRKQLGLSKRQMSALLNFGVNQYRYYENGEMPKGANLLLLRLLVNQGALPYILSAQADGLPEKTKKALLRYFDGKTQIVEVENTPKVNPGEEHAASINLNDKSFTDFSYLPDTGSQVPSISLNAATAA